MEVATNLRLTGALLVGLSLAACGGGDGNDNTPDAAITVADANNASDANNDPDANNAPDASIPIALASLTVVTQPVSSPAGTLLTVSVEARDMNGDLLTEVMPITLAIDTNPAPGVLGGTLSADTSAGVATFADLFINEAGVGYTLVASAGGFTDLTDAFDINAGLATALAFGIPPSNVEAMSDMPMVTVEVQDEFGNVVIDAVNDVTLRFTTNPGEALLHTSGNGTAVFETMDPTTLVGTGFLESIHNREIRGILHNAADGITYTISRATQDLLSLDSTGDVLTNLGQLTIQPRGLVFDPLGNGGTGRFLALEYQNPNLIEIDLLLATSTDLGALTATPAATGFTSLAIDPTNGSFYAIALTTNGGQANRRLVTIDPVGLTVTEIGALSEDSVAAITFRADGTLLAVTGDGGTEEVFTVDKATGVMTLVGSVDQPNAPNSDGECIGIVPARLLGGSSIASVAGVASFPGLQVDMASVGYTIEATAVGLTPAASAAFDITAINGVAGVATLDVATQTVAEDVGSVVVAVSIDVAQTHDVILTYQVGGDTDNPTDTNIDGTRLFNIRIAAGQTTGSRSIDIVDDAVAEGDENLSLTLANTAMGVNGAVTQHTITITDND